jgi:hypothetical protein
MPFIQTAFNPRAMKNIKEFIKTAMQPIIIFIVLLIAIVAMWITQHDQPL